MNGGAKPKASRLAFVLLMSFLSIAVNAKPAIKNITFNMVDDGNVSLADYSVGKPVYIKFWATWCQTCMAEMSHFEQLHQQHGDDIAFISVNMGINDDISSILSIVSEFRLTMPQAIDKSGDLAQLFGVVGTPYHILIDSKQNLVFKGFTDDSIDGKIAQLSNNGVAEKIGGSLNDLSNKKAMSAQGDEVTHVLFFTATWCDWYFEKTHPSMAYNCISAQKQVSSAFEKTDKSLRWDGYISRLWTEQKDAEEYQQKYQVNHPMRLDKTNQIFHQFSINKIPTLLVIKNNQVVSRVTNFSNPKSVINALNN